MLVAGQHPMGASGVIVLGMRHRADESDFVGHAAELRHKFGNTYTGSLGADGIEWTSQLGGGVGLHVEEVDVAGSTPHVQKQAALGLAESTRRLPRFL